MHRNAVVLVCLFPRFYDGNITRKGINMAKSQNSKKQTKKAPAKNAKEKKLAKRAKKSGK